MQKVEPAQNRNPTAIFHGIRAGFKDRRPRRDTSAAAKNHSSPPPGYRVRCGRDGPGSTSAGARAGVLLRLRAEPPKNGLSWAPGSGVGAGPGRPEAASVARGGCPEAALAHVSHSCRPQPNKRPSVTYQDPEEDAYGKTTQERQCPVCLHPLVQPFQDFHRIDGPPHFAFLCSRCRVLPGLARSFSHIDRCFKRSPYPRRTTALNFGVTTISILTGASI